MRIAVIVNRGKDVAGHEPGELRAKLEATDHDVAWTEVDKSKHAPEEVKRLVDEGVDLVVAWGGDGTVQHCVDALVSSGARDVPVAIMPAGTANIFASNLGIPIELDAALDVALSGARRRIDAGVVNGEHFVEIAGAGFDALLMRDMSGAIKRRMGRVGYVWIGLRHIRHAATQMRIEVDGREWFSGRAVSVLFGNVGTIFGGIDVFPDADPADGKLDVGVLRAEGLRDWFDVARRALTGALERSPAFDVTTAHRVTVELGRPLPYELDGGDRPETRQLDVHVVPAAIEFCVPEHVTAA